MEPQEPRTGEHLWADGDDSSNPSLESASATATGDTPSRVCRQCSTQSQTAGDYCPHCGASYVRKRRRIGRRVKIAMLTVLIALLGGGGAAAYVVKHHHDQQVAAKHKRELEAARAAAAAKRAKERARQRAAAVAAAEKRAEERFQRAMRKSLIASLRKSVTKDARKDVADGLLDGPILRTSCEPVGGGNVDDLAAHTGNWSCLAVTNDNADGTSSGYAFAATVNYDDGSYTWHLGH